MRDIPGGICAPTGFQAAGIHCGIKDKRPDLALVYSTTPAVAAATFTTNTVKAASVLLSIRHIRNHQAQAIIANSGNANACTGQQGLEDAQRMATAVAQRLSLSSDQVLVASTGVIGQPLPMDHILAGIETLCQQLSSQGSRQAAEAIMTTDRVVKEIAVETDIPRRSSGYVRIGGIIKGAGMIAPNMATMLCFITTDACIHADALEQAIRDAVVQSFNQCSVDGDMSTNDTVFVLANGEAGNERIKTWHKKPKIKVQDRGYPEFAEALGYVCTCLAKAIVRDGEGASRIMEINVQGAAFPKDARRIARAIAESPLVKTALAGASPNWGRLMSALGSADTRVRPSQIDIYIGEHQVVKAGTTAGADEEALRQTMKQPEVPIRIDLNDGSYGTTFWGCDLTERYVRINKRYL